MTCLKKIISCIIVVLFFGISVHNSIAESEDSRAIRLKDMTKDKKLALVIGNSAYESGGTLKNPVNDARDMKDALTRLGVDVMLELNCTQKEMKQAIRSFSERLESYPVGIFYYAGHGIQSEGENYLIPINADIQKEYQIQLDGVCIKEVTQGMAHTQNLTNIIILDTCRDNPFERKWTRSTVGRGLASMDAPVNTFIAYATSSGNVAADGSDRNGVFTKYILENITIPNLSVNRIFQRVRKQVKEETGNQQITWQASSLEHDFYFVFDEATFGQPDVTTEAELQRLKIKAEEAERKRQAAEDQIRQLKEKEKKSKTLRRGRYSAF